MIWAHLRAFVWLRWRLMANQWRRAGAFNAAVMTVATIAAVSSAVPTLLGGFVAAIYAIPRATPAQLMYAWDALIAGFLLFWIIGLMVDLQRNDPLSLSKFLHLPVSIRSAFLINYLSSLIRLSLLFFLPLMAAYALALVYVQGMVQLPVLPGLAAFLVLITAPTYQFQGWLASLMSNPRRRRGVIVGATMGFVLLLQTPNLIHLYLPQQLERQKARSARQVDELARVRRTFEAKQVDAQKFATLQKAIIDGFTAEAAKDRVEELARWERWARIANAVLPFGWMPIGVFYAAEGRVIPAILGVLGMGSIGGISLWLAFRATLGQFQGQGSNRKGREPAVRDADPKKPRGWMLLEARLPGISEPVAAVALGSFRSLLRSPEAKISLLSPLILGAVFGSILIRQRRDAPESLRPLMGIAAISFVLFGLLQMMGNQFGMDRDGFRAYALSAAPRRDILLGKNLAYLPAAVLLSAVMLVALQVLCPMRIDHFLGMAPQFISMFLLFCGIANLFSIYAPMSIAPGTLKPSNPKLSTVLLQLLMFLILFPLAQLLTMIPLGVESGLRALGRRTNAPICLILTVAESGLILLLYRRSMRWFGGRLQAREQQILEAVTNRAP